MKETIKEKMLGECKKLIGRHQFRVEVQKKNQAYYQHRTGLPAGLPNSYLPGHWKIDPLFNPFYVRSRADTIAHSIAIKIRNGTYEPHPALVKEIPKPGGGTRQVTIFQIPDSAVSLYLFRQLYARNAQFLSSYCYAYRSDRNAHHALDHLYRYVGGRQRQYVLEFDFSKYFDSISHDYLFEVMKRLLKVSPREERLIKSLLNVKRANDLQSYEAGQFTSPIDKRGVPQGSSISLFLANVACLELDRELERQGAVFARYADDIVIICASYDEANRCAALMFYHGERSETQINIEKSEGISLLARETKAEMRCKEAFDFLGHNISQRRITLSQRTVGRIKRRISTIIFRHLLLCPRRGTLSQTRVEANGVDWDMVTCINEIRRFVYGRISEEKITKCINDKSEPLVPSRCLLSFYPLVDDPQLIRELDGWLVSVIQRAQKERKRILAAQFPNYALYGRDELINGTWYRSNIQNETKLPSFFKSWQYVRKCVNVYGIQRFPNPPYSS